MKRRTSSALLNIHPPRVAAMDAHQRVVADLGRYGGVVSRR
jgi:hypothetical protein